MGALPHVIALMHCNAQQCKQLLSADQPAGQAVPCFALPQGAVPCCAVLCYVMT